MMMKNKISRVFDADKLEHTENIVCSGIYLADLTERTKNKENLKIYETKPDNIDTLLIENPNLLDISATFFKPQCFIDEKQKEPENCEGVFYLSNSDEHSWVLFVEIKDCKVKNISKYFNKAKEQIVNVVKIFRDKNIISQNKKVYANISFPKAIKTDFYNQLLKNDNGKMFIDKYKIRIKGTNHLIIKNDKTIK